MTGSASEHLPVIIAGGGVAGITAALDLAGSGLRVHLIEKDAVIGGQTARLDKLYPTDHCAFCPVWTQSRLCLAHPLITVHTHSCIDAINRIQEEGEDQGEDRGENRVEAVIKRVPNYIDARLCIFCGSCEAVCPENAVSPTLPHALPRTFLVDADVCTGCGRCVEVCPTRAVDMAREPGKTKPVKIKSVKTKIIAGNIIWATGFADTDISVLPEFGYGSHENIMTSLEFETLTAEAGPNRGEILTPQGKVPDRIAFIQCAGARDWRKFSFCSAVCCMHALKQARWVKRRNPNVECVIFFTDMRTQGRHYYAYYLEAVEKQSIKLVRGRPGLIRPLPGKDLLAVRYEDTLTGQLNTQGFDLVVLNGALDPGSRERTESSGNPVTDDQGFVCRSDQQFSCGFCRAPADVEVSAIQASSAAIGALGTRTNGNGTH
jgi:heterodisulfide reductase subunit A